MFIDAEKAFIRLHNDHLRVFSRRKERNDLSCLRDWHCITQIIQGTVGEAPYLATSILLFSDDVQDAGVFTVRGNTKDLSCQFLLSIKLPDVCVSVSIILDP